jgi:hypothetical protein
MGAVTRLSATTETTLHVAWTALTGDHTGGSIIDSYNVQWDKASNEV